MHFFRRARKGLTIITKFVRALIIFPPKLNIGFHYCEKPVDVCLRQKQSLLVSCSQFSFLSSDDSGSSKCCVVGLTERILR